MSFGSSNGVNPGRKKKKNVQSPNAQNKKVDDVPLTLFFWVGCFWLFFFPKNWRKERRKTSRVVIISNSGLQKRTKPPATRLAPIVTVDFLLESIFFQGFVNTQLRSITNFLDSLSLTSWYLVGTTPGFCFSCGSQKFYWAANCFAKFPKKNSFNCLTPLYYLISSPSNPPLWRQKKTHGGCWPSGRGVLPYKPWTSVESWKTSSSDFSFRSERNTLILPVMEASKSRSLSGMEMEG